MLDVVQDVRYAGRLIRRSPAYSLTVVCVLAIGIAANVIAFSLFKSLTIAPLAGVRDSGRLLFIGARSDGGQILPQSFPDYEYARDHGFPGLAAWAIQPLILGNEGEGRQVMGEFVTGNYFSVLEVGAAAGRTLTPADVVRNGAPVVVISHGLWQRAFGGDTAIVGRTIRLNAQPVTVAGVSSARFRGAIVGLSTGVFVPITMQPQLVGSNSIDSRNNRWVHPFMRPPPGVPRETLEAEVGSLARAISQTAPERDLELALVPFLRWPYGAQSIMLPAASLIGVTALLLLAVVSANAAGLVLVRSLARRGETAARLTLGASVASFVPAWRGSRVDPVEALRHH